MNKTHYAAILAALVLFLGLYFGFDTKPDRQQTVERSRELQGEATSLETLVADGRQHLSAEQSAELAALEARLAADPDDTTRTALLKRMSGLWFRSGNPAVAGGLAEQVAEMENTDSAWSVAGATFYHALVETQDPVRRAYTAQHAVKAFESAASLNPANPEHRVNLALVYAENPPPDNPMQAVLMLRELETKHPDNPAVYNALGRLAIKTGQWERALQRLEKARTLDPANRNTSCLLAKAYEGAGQADKAEEFAKICNQ
jgi:tetratricopeptide (TPR) repeat protein